MGKILLNEGLFENFFVKIGAESVWRSYENAYSRYTKERLRCQEKLNSDEIKECELINDLNILMLKIRTLKRAMSYCRNTKKPDKCRQKLAKLIKKNNDLMKLKRDALQKLHEKINKKIIKKREEERELKVKAMKAI